MLCQEKCIPFLQKWEQFISARAIRKDACGIFLVAAQLLQ